MDKTGELPVAETDTRWRANDIRLALMNEFAKDRLWLFVAKNNETAKYEVLAANDWCGQLSPPKLEQLREFCALMTGKLESLSTDEQQAVVAGPESEALCHATASR